MKQFLLFFVLTVSISASAAVHYDVKCSNANGYELTFNTLTSNREDSWCSSGTGEFQLFFRNRLVHEVSADWNNCSKSGIRTSTESGPLIIRYRELGGSDSATLSDQRGNQLAIFDCELPVRSGF